MQLRSLGKSEHIGYNAPCPTRNSGVIPLLLMVKPPPEIAALLAGDPRADAHSADRIHMAILPLGPGRPALIEQVMAALATTEIAQFRVAFDRIHASERTVALRGSEAMRGAIRAQAAIRDRLIRHGIRLRATPSTPTSRSPTGSIGAARKRSTLSAGGWGIFG